MRRAFAETLSELTRQDPRVLLMSGDLGFMALEPFSEAHPGRFFNAGVAEQNMAGMATGLAEAGYIPFIYSIVTFAVLRPFEFLRNGPIAHRLPVRIVSVGGGLEYGHNGISHYGLEDIGVLRTQPGITIICPCDPAQARTAIRETWNLPGPIYYRLGKDDRAVMPGLEGKFALGQAATLRGGNDILLLALGPAAHEALEAAALLAGNGVSAKVLAVSSFECANHITAELARFRYVVTVEAHYTTGGLGSWVSELVAENGIPCKVTRCGVRTLPDGTSGSQAFLHERHGLSASKLAGTAIAALNGA